MTSEQQGSGPEDARTGTRTSTVGEKDSRVSVGDKATVGSAGRGSPRTFSSRYRTFLGLCRSLHIYLTMLVLVLLFFFSVTGFMMNHEEWFGMTDKHTTTETGTLPANLLVGPDRLGVVEYLRAHLGAGGAVNSFGIDADTLRVAFRSPGQSIDAEIARTTGATTVTRESSGLLGLLCDLHRGKNAGDGWPWIIDAVAILLFAGATTGLLLWLSLPRRRNLGLVVLVTSVAAVLAVYFLVVP